jgi:hypothetical protein
MRLDVLFIYNRGLKTVRKNEIPNLIETCSIISELKSADKYGLPLCVHFTGLLKYFIKISPKFYSSEKNVAIFATILGISA